MKHFEEVDVYRIYSDNGDYLWLSEKAENRLSWILAGIIFLAIALPVGALAFLM